MEHMPSGLWFNESVASTSQQRHHHEYGAVISAPAILTRVNASLSSRQRLLNNASSANVDSYDDVDPSLTAFGYPCTLFRDDVRAEELDGGTHLMPLPYDSHVTTDRYDCRLLLSNPIQDYCSNNVGQNYRSISLEEQELEHLCDEERYSDLKQAEIDLEKEKISQNSAAIPYTYDDNNEGLVVNQTNNQTRTSSSDDDDDFTPTLQLRVPKEMITPTSHVQNTVIEKTAIFIAEKGAQMEIVVNAKQKSNKRFRFLDFENPLHKYYKHVLKMVREKKYSPNFDSIPQPAKKKKKGLVVNKIEKEEAEMSGTDSDSDADYLHPSLLARKPSNNEHLANFTTSQKPTVLSATLQSQKTEPTSNYKLGEGDDVYSELYNRLSAFLPKKTASEPCLDKNSDQVQIDEQESWVYYANMAAKGGIPPPPDIQPIIDRLADYVARNGVEFEQMVRATGDERFAFLQQNHDFHPFYCSRVHWHQYQQYMGTVYYTVAENHHVITPTSSLQLQPQIAQPILLKSAPKSAEPKIRMSKSVQDFKPFEKTDGQTISFIVKCKEKQQSLAEQSEKPVYNGQKCEPTTSKVGFSILDDEQNPSMNALVETNDDLPELDENLKIERKKKAKLFLDLLKRGKSASKNETVSEQTENATVIQDKIFVNNNLLEEPKKKKRRRFDVKPEDLLNDNTVN